MCNLEVAQIHAKCFVAISLKEMPCGTHVPSLVPRPSQKEGSGNETNTYLFLLGPDFCHLLP